MTDIVERLRDHDRHVRGRLIEGLPDLCIDDMIEAADEIERLRDELEAAWNQCPYWFVKARKAAIGEGKE
jgi:hypothetical protein